MISDFLLYDLKCKNLILAFSSHNLVGQWVFYYKELGKSQYWVTLHNTLENNVLGLITGKSHTNVHTHIYTYKQN